MTEKELSGVHVDTPLDDAHQRQLLQDLLLLRAAPQFGKRCTIGLAWHNCYDRFVIKFPLAGEAVIAVLVAFSHYPAMECPQLTSKGDWQSQAVIEEVQRALQGQRGLVSMHDVVRLICEAADRQQVPTIVPAQAHPLDDCPRASAMPSPSIGYLALQGWGLLGSALLGLALVTGFLLECAPLLFRAVFAGLAPRPLPSSPRPSGAGAAGAPAPTAAQPGALCTRTVEKLFIPERLVQRIQRDYARCAPNEYAFLCSGILTPEGTALVVDYYRGEMEVSTPVSCRLTRACINDTLYQRIPTSHQLVIWGHVHPMEGPSQADTAAFRHLAEWEWQAADTRLLSKKSLALLMNGCTDRLSFYDVHSTRLIPHGMIAAGGSAPYDTPD